MFLLATGCPPAEPPSDDAGIDAALSVDDAAAPRDAGRDARDAPEGDDTADATTADAGTDVGPSDATVFPDACPSPTTLCGATCVDLTADPDHCGACDTPCVPLAGSIAFCGSRRCIPAVCRPGFGNCNGNRLDGCEVSVDTSVEHCGFCDNPCPAAPHATPGCADALCTLACEPGWIDCDPGTAGCECETPDGGA